MKNNSTVSIIIPVYNSEKYIGRCLDSVLNQTYKNIDIIVINDGSTDHSQEIIDDYKKKYSNIIAIEQENMGVSKTRNKAIKMAKTKYIMFIDNDDFIDKEYVEKHLKVAEEGEYDIVLSGYRRPNENGKIVKKMESTNEIWSRMMIFAPWAKIYKTEYLKENDIEFLDNNLGEDVYFNLQAMLLTDKIKIIDYIGYNWFYNTKSISNTIQKDIRQMQVYELLNNCYDILVRKNTINKHYEMIEMYFIRYIIWLLTFSTKRLPYKTISEEYDKIFNWLKDRFPNYKKNKLIGITKPKGEIFSVRIFTFVFMKAHNIKLGKLLIFIYSKI